MKPGQIYNLFFPFKPGEPLGKIRPEIIMSISPDGTAIAVMVKITTSPPTPHFPHRIEIVHFQVTSLDKQSYAEVDSYSPFDLSNIQHSYRGELAESDFNKVLMAYLKFRTKSKSINN